VPPLRGVLAVTERIADAEMRAATCSPRSSSACIGPSELQLPGDQLPPKAHQEYPGAVYKHRLWCVHFAEQQSALTLQRAYLGRQTVVLVVLLGSVVLVGVVVVDRPTFTGRHWQPAEQY
jgi:hypothetical protein